MEKDINYEIVKELENQKINIADIYDMLYKLDTNSHKYKFLSYLVDNRNTLFKWYELDTVVEEIIS